MSESAVDTQEGKVTLREVKTFKAVLIRSISTALSKDAENSFVYDSKDQAIMAYSLPTRSLRHLTVANRPAFTDSHFTAILLEPYRRTLSQQRQPSALLMRRIAALEDFAWRNDREINMPQSLKMPEECALIDAAYMFSFMKNLGFHIIDSHAGYTDNTPVIMTSTTPIIGESIRKFRKTPQFQRLKEQADVHAETHAAVEELLRN